MSCVKIHVVWVENLLNEVKIGFVDCVETAKFYKATNNQVFPGCFNRYVKKDVVEGRRLGKYDVIIGFGLSREKAIEHFFYNLNRYREMLVGEFKWYRTIKKSAEKLGGHGGGGRPDLAQAGGTDVSNAMAVVDMIKKEI